VVFWSVISQIETKFSAPSNTKLSDTTFTTKTTNPSLKELDR
jgi:hypothetical protein